MKFEKVKGKEIDLNIAELEEGDALILSKKSEVIVRTDGSFHKLYTCSDVLGKGKFGVVKKCVDKATGILYAAKFVQKTPEAKKDVLREVKMMNMLHHKRLIQLYNAFETPKEMIVVLELVTGGELFEKVVEEDNLTEKQVVRYMRQVLYGVQHMHHKNMVHLDLKPENILCVDGKPGYEELKLIDFGMTRELKPGVNETAACGTPEFVAPEVISFRPITTASDMWSIGVITYVLLSGLSPFMGESDFDTLKNVASGEYDFDDDDNIFENISNDAKNFIQELLLLDPKQRNTVDDCLNHEWFRKGNEISSKRLKVDKLRKYLARKRWAKAIKVVLATNRFARGTFGEHWGNRKSESENDANEEENPRGSPGHPSELSEDRRKIGETDDRKISGESRVGSDVENKRAQGDVEGKRLQAEADEKRRESEAEKKRREAEAEEKRTEAEAEEKRREEEAEEKRREAEAEEKRKEAEAEEKRKVVADGKRKDGEKLATRKVEEEKREQERRDAAQKRAEERLKREDEKKKARDEEIKRKEELTRKREEESKKHEDELKENSKIVEEQLLQEGDGATRKEKEEENEHEDHDEERRQRNEETSRLEGERKQRDKPSANGFEFAEEEAKKSELEELRTLDAVDKKNREEENSKPAVEDKLKKQQSTGRDHSSKLQGDTKKQAASPNWKEELKLKKEQDIAARETACREREAKRNAEMKQREQERVATKGKEMKKTLEEQLASDGTMEVNKSENPKPIVQVATAAAHTTAVEQPATGVVNGNGYVDRERCEIHECLVTTAEQKATDLSQPGGGFDASRVNAVDGFSIMADPSVPAAGQSLPRHSPSSSPEPLPKLNIDPKISDKNAHVDGANLIVNASNEEASDENNNLVKRTAVKSPRKFASPDKGQSTSVRNRIAAFQLSDRK